MSAGHVVVFAYLMGVIFGGLGAACGLLFPRRPLLGACVGALLGGAGCVLAALVLA